MTIMMKCFESAERGLIVVSLGEGDLLLESIQQAVRQANVHTGVIASGLGSLTRAHIHTLGVEAQLPGPLEVVGLGGIVAGYEPHIHISLTDATGRYYGGHLLEGCSILTVAEISILRVPDLKLTRRVRDGSRVELLDLE
jgi:predicted DNA-binding protein with PD1-like motif